MTLPPGTQVGPYEIAEQIGAGGMGEVYRARDSRLRRDVALKVLPPDFATDAERLQRFEQEAWAAGMLNHPNVVAVYDFGSHEGSPYVVSELLEGQTLREALKEGPLAPRKAIELAVGAARGLAAAHAKGIVHRDLKPENIFITRDGRVKVLDFGLAKLAPRERRASSSSPESTVALFTEIGIVLGTAGYMSPEQVRGLDTDHRSDIFSFGLILYEMLAGRRAFSGESSIEMMSAILKDEPAELGAAGRKLPPGVARVVEHCLEKEPAQRFQSVEDLIFALQAITGISEAGAAASERRKRRWQLPAAAAAGLLAGALAMLPFVHREPAEPPSFRYLTYSGRDYSPAASPGGRFLAFTSDRDGTPRIWLKQLPEGDERPLTSGPDDFARFSPLGSILLFTRRENGGTALYRVGVVGGDPRKMVEDAAEGDWSPDGRQVAFVRWKMIDGRVNTSVGIAGGNGSEAREIARFADRKLARIRWSPDGAMLAASEISFSGSAQPILLISLDGKVRELKPPKAGYKVSSLAWLDPGEVLYLQNESALEGGLGVNTGTANVIRQDIWNGAARRLAWSPGSSTVLDVAGPGRIVFDTCSPRASLREVALDRPGARAARWLTQGASNDRQPAYSPDGEWVVFSSNRSGNLDLWKLSTRTEVVARLTDDEAEDWDPAFTPDGKRLLWSSNRGGHFEIWTADVDGSGARRVTADGVDAENPTATRDGRWIVYVSTNPAKQGIWKIHPDGSDAVRLVEGNFAMPEVSPDGRYTLYSSNYMSEQVPLHVVDVDTGRPEPFTIQVGVAGGKPGVALGRARWMPDGKSIAFIGRDEDGLSGVFVQEFAPGRDTSATRRALAGFDPQFATESFGIAPGGSRATLACWEQMFSLMMAERLAGVGPRARAR